MYTHLHTHSYAHVSLCTLRFDMNRMSKMLGFTVFFRVRYPCLSSRSCVRNSRRYLSSRWKVEGPKFHRHGMVKNSLVYPRHSMKYWLVKNWLLMVIFHHTEAGLRPLPTTCGQVPLQHAVRPNLGTTKQADVGTSWAGDKKNRPRVL